MRKGYRSDIKREQLEAIRPLLESARRKTAPRKVELCEVFCAVLYLLRTGCQWRALPSEFFPVAHRALVTLRSGANHARVVACWSRLLTIRLARPSARLGRTG